MYRDPSGLMEVNLQTAEVYLWHRLTAPTPDLIARNEDFLTVFPHRTPLCTQVANNKHRRTVRILHNG